MPEEPNDSDIFKDYEEGKHRRYSLLFAVGGAFAVAKLYATECSREECKILGSLEVWHLSLGMALFTIVMVSDIFMFGENMRKKTSGKDSTNRHRLSLSKRLSDFFSRSGLFSLQGKLVLISIGLLISAGWTLVSFQTFGVLGLALVVLGLLGSIATVILLPPPESSSDQQKPAREDKRT
jgi:hypothetical protein